MSARWLPPRDKVMQNRWLRPFARHLDQDCLWHFERESVARGVALGLFFGLMLPVAQFLFAVLSAIALRANVPVATAATLVTNPLTFPPIYWLAWHLGCWITRAPLDEAAAEAAIGQAPQVSAPATGWLESSLAWVQAAGLPLATGLLALAVGASLVGYVTVSLLWRVRRH
ncbi:DUF2062 domain-containing protein [Caldimonas tepidiphila]|uniref:DUF2062 domain-containing protein n=1 Tax=Caldimonas tepidiphila TaxID=2315841 RepID=UPI000E5B3FDF|nr:DUF2062 domain-containing protein [Caldimonas tepidiphila]